MEEIVQVESKVISLGEESNDMYMSLDMIFLTSEVNLNKIQFSEDFIYGIEAEKEKYIGLPLQCDITKLEKGEYDKLTHKYNKKTNKFATASIGSFVDFKTQKNGDILELVASARVWKRNPKTCEALEELYGSDEGLKFSYEVLVGKSSKENGNTFVPKDDSNNPIGSCVVSTPAVPASKATLLVAEAYETDFIINENILIEGGETLTKEIKKRDSSVTCEEMFAETKLHLSTELAELDNSQIRKKIWKALKDMLLNDYWNWDITDQYPTYIVIQHWDSGDYYKVDYTLSDADVTLSEKKKVTKTYQDVEEVNTEVATIKELEKTIADLKTELATSNTTISEKDTLIATKDTEISSLNEKVTTLSETVISKDTELAELAPIKEEHEKLIAEKAEEKLKSDRNTLKEKYSSLLTAEIMVKPEIAEAIEKLDESVLKDAVVEVAMAKAKDTKPVVESASRITDEVSIGKKDLVSKYVTITE